MKTATKATRAAKNAPRIENMINSRGNTAPNQFLIYTPEGVVFQSYFSVIAFRDHGGNVTLDCNKWNYSRTTGKFRNQFLDEKQKATQDKIDNGIYGLTDLNP